VNYWSQHIRISWVTEEPGTKKKMTQGWVVYGGMRHAEPQGDVPSQLRARAFWLCISRFLE
jgi:hypothetical protein